MFINTYIYIRSSYVCVCRNRLHNKEKRKDGARLFPIKTVSNYHNWRKMYVDLNLLNKLKLTSKYQFNLLLICVLNIIIILLLYENKYFYLIYLLNVFLI